MSHNYNLKRRSASTRFYKFIDEEDWGLLIETTPLTTPKVLETLREMGNGVCFVEEGIGKLLLDRQSTIYMHLQVLLDDIMELKRQLENPDAVAPKRKMIGECISEDLKTLGISNAHSPGLPSVSTSTYTVSELAELANEQYDAVDDHVHLLRHEPQYLAEIAKQYYYSSPEFVVDEKGQHDFVIMHNAYNNRVVKRAFRDAYEARTTWKSITVLIAAIDKDTTKHPGNVVTKELWSLCCMELTRACAVFKQMLLADHKMERYFVRKGAFVTLKIPIEVIERKNAYQGLLIRIACTKPPDTDIAKYLKEIYEFDKRSLGFRENISERAGPAFGDIEVITAFMARLRRVISLPKQATSNVFVKAIKEHVLHLESAIEQVNLDDFVAPLDNLKEPLAAQGCIDFLDNACIQSSYAFHETVGIALAQVLERLEDDDAKVTLHSPRGNLHK